MQMNMRGAKPKYPPVREVKGKRAQSLAAATAGAYAFWVGLVLALILWGG